MLEKSILKVSIVIIISGICLSWDFESVCLSLILLSFVAFPHVICLCYSCCKLLASVIKATYYHCNERIEQ